MTMQPHDHSAVMTHDHPAVCDAALNLIATSGDLYDKAMLMHHDRGEWRLKMLVAVAAKEHDMNAPDIREVHMTKPTFAEVCADAYAPHFAAPVLRIQDAHGSVYITCVDRALAEAAADAINAAIGAKP